MRKLNFKTKQFDDVPDDDWEDPFGNKPEGLITVNGKEIQLNEGQLEALRAGKTFLKSKESFMCIQGSAGSGKTTVSNAILEGEYSVIVTAPTHKAKKIVSRATGRRGETIQKIVGLKPDVTLEKFSATNVLFALIGQNLMADYRVVLIDEASMLNQDLVNLLKERAKSNGSKIIFLGDPRQLPPVKETISKVFVDEDILQVKLTKVERQKEGNPLIGLYDKILNRIDKVDAGVNADNLPFEIVDNMQDGIGYKFIHSPQEFGNELIPYFKLGEDLDNKIIAWTNDSVRQWNNFVRKKLVGDHHKPFQVGEILMAYNSLTDQEDWRHIVYENSAEYIVTKVTEGYKPAANYEKTVTADIFGYFVHIKDLDNDRDEEKIFIVKHESYNDYIKIEQMYYKFAESALNNKKWAWKTYYEFRNQFSLMSDIKKSYIGVVKNTEKIVVDFDFGYAQTIHKAQGSTYKNVFMVDDIYNNPSQRELWRLAYVALSRPREGAYILNSRPR